MGHALMREVKVPAMAETLSNEKLLREIKDEAVQMCCGCSVPGEEGHRPIFAEAPHRRVRESKERRKS